MANANTTVQSAVVALFDPKVAQSAIDAQIKNTGREITANTLAANPVEPAIKEMACSDGSTAIIDTATNKLIRRTAPDPTKAAAAATHPAVKQKLSAASRQATKEQTIGSLMCEVGETWGNYSVLAEDLQATAEQQMQDALVAAKKLGLTKAMLKAGADCYNALVNTMQAVRAANGLKTLGDATRDNYLSRIRNFVDGKDKQLDLFGNKKVKEAKKAGTFGKTKRAARPEGNSSDATTPQPTSATLDASQQAAQSKVDDVVREKSLRGAEPLGRMLAAWIEANETNAALANVRKMAGDLLNTVNILTGAKK